MALLQAGEAYALASDVQEGERNQVWKLEDGRLISLIPGHYRLYLQERANEEDIYNFKKTTRFSTHDNWKVLLFCTKAGLEAFLKWPYCFL